MSTTSRLLLAAAIIATPATAQVASPVTARDPGPAAPVQYDVAFPNAVHHEARITATWRNVPTGPLRVQMARSSPGRYAIHEFAKNVYDVTAVDGTGRALTLTRTDPYGWSVSGHDGTVAVTYTLYGDHGDGTYAQIDMTHAHLNMPATFLWATGFDAQPIRVRFRPADPSWKIATQLPAASGEATTFWAPNLQYFMDSPTELSNFTLREWQDAGRTYRLAMHHDGTDADVDRFAAKAKKVVHAQIATFGAPPAYDFGTYTFIADYLPYITGDGMEHRNSTIISDKRSLYAANDAQLNTLSHEFFHSWNVERIRPAELEPFDFTRANPTPSLWVAEGFTQYYGPLAIRRAGEMSVDAYLATLGGTLNAVLNSPARAHGGPKEMSLRAPFVDAAKAIDAVNPNIFVSYYIYGATLAAALDLELRGRYSGQSLDTYMRLLWKRHGAPEKPYTIADLRTALATLTGDQAFADRFFAKSVEGSDLPDFAALLAQAGLTWQAANPGGAWVGAADVTADGPAVTLSQSPAAGTALYAAGVERGDRIIALGRTTVTSAQDWQSALGRLEPGTPLDIRYVQRGKERAATLTPNTDSTKQLVRSETVGKPITAKQRAFRTAWLGAE
ncbi:M61 family metallopeptidase [Microvirga sp. SRT01]|uniref:M61 family metallopeptidase n=1 Tax=Sphingomonas longa TaxID=2778730 RepID=A0ABS2D3B7_9SPHN|nr:MULTISPECIES: site-2 protease family protein [Alphaproteobacteria]MBM6575404.1 M61 family metallopeptidase [Sphingomonas sp. BT552]MBR7708453.1 M61 family metallopeptidase [Microvirga sp. SRT01]